jgi:hypothetical protein
MICDPIDEGWTEADDVIEEVREIPPSDLR